MKSRNWPKLIPVLLAPPALVLVIFLGGIFEEAQIRDLAEDCEARNAELSASFRAGAAEEEARHASEAARLKAEIADVAAQLEARTAELRALRGAAGKPVVD